LLQHRISAAPGQHASMYGLGMNVMRPDDGSPHEVGMNIVRPDRRFLAKRRSRYGSKATKDQC